MKTNGCEFFSSLCALSNNSNTDIPTDSFTLTIHPNPAPYPTFGALNDIMNRPPKKTPKNKQQQQQNTTTEKQPRTCKYKHVRAHRNTGVYACALRRIYEGYCFPSRFRELVWPNGKALGC